MCIIVFGLIITPPRLGLSPLLVSLLSRGDCCGIASDLRGDVGLLSLFDDTGVEGVVDCSHSLVFGANETLRVPLVGEFMAETADGSTS